MNTEFVALALTVTLQSSGNVYDINAYSIENLGAYDETTCWSVVQDRRDKYQERINETEHLFHHDTKGICVPVTADVEPVTVGVNATRLSGINVSGSPVTINGIDCGFLTDNLLRIVPSYAKGKLVISTTCD